MIHESTAPASSASPSRATADVATSREGRTTVRRLADKATVYALYVLARALQGLTYNEARHAIRRATAQGRPLSADAVPLLEEHDRRGQRPGSGYIPVDSV